MLNPAFRRRVALASAALLAGLAAGCSPGVQAPSDTGVCWHMVMNGPGQTGGVVSSKYRFFVLKKNVPDLEHCAAALDGMRVRFLALGGSAHEVTGIYQGEYLFVDPRGVFAANSLNAPPFPTLTRTEDGRLLTPSQASQAQQAQ